MELPFTVDQFFEVMRHYNEAIWPMQAGLYLLALIATGLYLFQPPQTDRAISAILAFLWAWTGIAYHLIFFTEINKAAFGFAVIFLAGAGAFLWSGVLKNQLVFAASGLIRRIIGGTLVIFALLIYPTLASFLGHGYPSMPTFGLPCPTTIFTIGMLCFLEPPYPRFIFVAPILWSAIGCQAAFLLGVYEDLALLVAGFIALVLMFQSKKRSNYSA